MFFDLDQRSRSLPERSRSLHTRSRSLRQRSRSLLKDQDHWQWSRSISGSRPRSLFDQNFSKRQHITHLFLLIMIWIQFKSTISLKMLNIYWLFSLSSFKRRHFLIIFDHKYSRYRIYGHRIYGQIGYMVNFELVPIFLY